MILKNINLTHTFLFGISLVLASLFTATVSAAASENVESQTSSDSGFFLNELSTNNEVTPTASWGQVVLTWNKKEYAYATMKTYAGKAYYLSAKVSGSDHLGSIPPSTNSGYNMSSITTGKILSRSKKSSVTWKAYGEIKDTSTSGTQTATTSKTVL